MFRCSQFRTLIIEPVLSKLQVYSKEAEELLVFTCAAESLGGTFLAQVNGPALGVYQMEPLTHDDIWTNFIKNRNSMAMLMSLHHSCHKVPLPSRLIWDLHYATAMARIHYLRCPGKIPRDTDAIWEYYKKYYNTVKGKATKEESIKKYETFIKS